MSDTPKARKGTAIIKKPIANAAMEPLGFKDFFRQPCTANERAIRKGIKGMSTIPTDAEAECFRRACWRIN